MIDINKRISELVKKRGISAASLIEKTGIPKASMHNYLSGRTKIDVNNLQLICEAAEINTALLFDPNYQEQDKLLELEEKIETLESEVFYKKKLIELLKSKQIKSFYMNGIEDFLINTYNIKFDSNGNISKLPSEEILSNSGFSELEITEIKKAHKIANESLQKSKSIVVNEKLYHEIIQSIEYLLNNEKKENDFYIQRVKQMSKNASLDQIGNPNFWIESIKMTGNNLAKEYLRKNQSKVDNYISKHKAEIKLKLKRLSNLNNTVKE
jgi:transcriptional regulator with XRE-family HTH domain